MYLLYLYRIHRVVVYVFILYLYIILYTYVVHAFSIPCIMYIRRACGLDADCKTETDNESPRKLQDATTQYMIRYASRAAVCSTAMITIVINIIIIILDDIPIFDRPKPSDIITGRCLFTCQFYYSYTHISGANVQYR